MPLEVLGLLALYDGFRRDEKGFRVRGSGKKSDILNPDP